MGPATCSRMCAIIPAAGYGTRQLPASKSIPKELLPVFDRPCIQYALEDARVAGIHRIGLVTMRGKSALEDYLDPHLELEAYLRSHGQTTQATELESLIRGLEVTYVRQPGPRGVGDAVLAARPLAGEGPFVVMLADDILDPPGTLLNALIALQSQTGGAVIALQEVPSAQTGDYGIASVEVGDGGALRVTDLVEKPAPSAAPSNLAVVGRYVLPPDMFDILACTGPGRNGEVQLTDALRVLAGQGRVHGVLVTGRRFDAGTPLGLLEASLYFAWKSAGQRDELRRILGRVCEENP